jgi:acetoin utilization deacetylase AcuC-like enzyme
MQFFSDGFGARRDDDIAEFNLLEGDYTWVSKQVKDIADTYSQGRIASVLEGGYELRALGRSVRAHLKVLSGL